VSPLSPPANYRRDDDDDSGSCSARMRFREYRGALIMNNLGVSLLERGCYKPAMSTLKDAVHSMRVAFQQKQNKPCGSATTKQHQHSSSDVDKKVRKAFKRWSKTRAKIDPARTSSSQRQRLDSVSYEDSFVSLPCLDWYNITDRHQDDEENLEGCYCQCFRPTRIEVPDEPCCMSDREAELETVVVLCNFGLSYYLISKAMEAGQQEKDEEKGVTSARLLKDALGIFDLASNILANRFAMCCDDIDEAKVLSVALLVSGNLAKIHRDTGNTKAANELSAKCDSIRSAICACEMMMEWFGMDCRIAAPAA